MLEVTVPMPGTLELIEIFVWAKTKIGTAKIESKDETKKNFFIILLSYNYRVHTEEAFELKPPIFEMFMNLTKVATRR